MELLNVDFVMYGFGAGFLCYSIPFVISWAVQRVFNAL